MKATKRKSSRKGKTQTKLKQEAFAREYVINGGNAYQAAITAGYSEKYAHSSSHKLCDIVGIKAMIDKHRKIEDEKYNFSITQKKKWLSEIIEAGLEKRVNYETGLEEGRQALPAANQAIEILNKMDGSYKEDNTYKIESTGEQKLTLTVEESLAILEEAGVDPEAINI